MVVFKRELMRKFLYLPTVLLFIAGASAQSVVITEINYNCSLYFVPDDWAELYNNTNDAIDLSAWMFTDEVDTHGFVLPQNTFLDSGGFILVCADTVAFKSYFPGVQNYFGNFEFGLSGGGELLRLYNAQGNLIDYVIYDDQPPWPTEPDGHGPTLELIDPSLPNTEPENWRSSLLPYGSPGLENGWVGVAPNPSPAEMRADYQLLSAYPNPFNPVVNLIFHLPKAENVSLAIFDVKGREVSKLMSERCSPGVYQITFDAAHFPSGMYFARLIAGDFRQTQKLLLVK